MKSKITFEIVSDLFNAGTTEDGREYHAEVYYVQAEHEDGRRWNHPARFHGARRGYTEDGVFFEDCRKVARGMARAVKRIAEIQYEFGQVDFRSWSEESPVYGSASWGREDEYNLMDDEEKARFF